MQPLNSALVCRKLFRILKKSQKKRKKKCKKADGFEFIDRFSHEKSKIVCNFSNR